MVEVRGFFWGRKNTILLQESQAFPARPSDGKKQNIEAHLNNTHKVSSPFK
jgi:hypothetical protein